MEQGHKFKLFSDKLVTVNELNTGSAE